MQQSDPLFSWTHIEVMGVVLVPFIIFWLDTRHEAQRMHEETMQQDLQMHLENQKRLTTIETKIASMMEPMFTWWVNRIKNGD
jgi:hypothetical protein